MRPLRTTVLILSIVCLAAVAWADYQAGVDAYNRGDFTTALSELGPLAEQGDPSAQFYLGLLYEAGDGVPQDFVKARKWYEKAAAQGYANAQNNLGYLYVNGKGVPKDERKGVEWIRKAAEQGDANGQDSLGEMYRDGRGVQ